MINTDVVCRASLTSATPWDNQGLENVSDPTRQFCGLEVWTPREAVPLGPLPLRPPGLPHQHAVCLLQDLPSSMFSVIWKRTNVLQPVSKTRVTAVLYFGLFLYMFSLCKVGAA